MAITNASRLSDFGAGIGTKGAILQVDNANKRTGIGTTNPNSTLTVGNIGVAGTSLFVHGDGRFIGVVTATSFSGNGANLDGVGIAGVNTAGFSTFTNFKASGISTFVGIVSCSDVVSSGIITADAYYGDGSNLTGTGIAGINTTGFSTFRDVKHAGISTFVGIVSCSDVVSTGIITAKAFIPVEGQLSHRNILINGAMRVAQYQSGIGSTNTSGYGSVDRFQVTHSGTNEAPWASQETLSTSDAPYDYGFRYCLQILNGNQSGGAGAGDYIQWKQQIEAQNIAQCGWDYNSASSYLTLSFWVRSSVAQAFYGYLRTPDGTAQIYPFSTGTLGANTWTKITKTIPGLASGNITIDNDVNLGLQVTLWAFGGTNYSDSGVSVDTWAAYASGTRFPDNTSTWYTTDNATLKITGAQLEVGSVPTPFEHRTFIDDQLACQRYFQQIGASGQDGQFCIGASHLTSAGDQTRVGYFGPTNLRATPTITEFGAGLRVIGSGSNTEALSMDDIAINYPSPMLQFNATCTDIGDDNEIVVVTNTADGGIYISAEIG